MRGIEPPYSAWEADVLPLNYIRERGQSVAAAAPGCPSAAARYGAARDPVGPQLARGDRRPAGSSSTRSTTRSSSRRRSTCALDRLFRVFRNHTAGVIDVKQDLTGLTELVEIADDGVFMLHPGEFVLGSTLERVAVPDDLVARIEGKSSLGRLGLLIHSHGRVHRRRVRRPHHARAGQRRQPADHALPGHEDRPDQLHADDHAGRPAVRQGRHRLEVPGPAGPDAEPLLRELPLRAASPTAPRGTAGQVRWPSCHRTRPARAAWVSW